MNYQHLSTKNWVWCQTMKNGSRHRKLGLRQPKRSFWNRGFDQQAGLTKIKNLTSIVAGLENLNLPQNAKPNWMILDDNWMILDDDWYHMDGFNSLDPSHGLSRKVMGGSLDGLTQLC